jgi:hypothetical protein
MKVEKIYNEISELNLNLRSDQIYCYDKAFKEDQPIVIYSNNHQQII